MFARQQGIFIFQYDTSVKETPLRNMLRGPYQN